jgi:hypothetical protein
MPGLIGQHQMMTVMITDVLTMTIKNLAGTSFEHQLHQEPYKGGDLHTYLSCCFHSPAMLHPLLGGKPVSLMMPLLTY